MGKPTGFKEYKREALQKNEVAQRVTNYQEFEKNYNDEKAQVQAARCMDCGVPFCHGNTGCPVDNLIPEWNDYVYRGHWKEALMNLHSTNNFPEFTGRLCPAPCESACVLGIIEPPVSIKALERKIVDHGFKREWIKPRPAKEILGTTVAVVGSGPAGLACAQQLARKGHLVTVFEKNEKPGGLMRFGIPDFKMEKSVIDRRLSQMEDEGIKFKLGVNIGVDITSEELYAKFNAVVLAGGSERPRDLPIIGREAQGVHFAMDFLTQQNRVNAGSKIENQILATRKNVVVIGGGDTGSDCVGTSIRQKAASVTQIELFPKPPNERSANTPWPQWPMKLRTSSSHEEGCKRLWSVNTASFELDNKNNLTGLNCNKVEFKEGKIVNIAGSEFKIKAELVFLAMGFLHPEPNGMIEQFQKLGLELDERKNVKADFGKHKEAHATSLEKVFACGDMRRGQSLIVWAIAEGRHCAEAVDSFLMSK